MGIHCMLETISFIRFQNNRPLLIFQMRQAERLNQIPDSASSVLVFLEHPWDINERKATSLGNIPRAWWMRVVVNFGFQMDELGTWYGNWSQGSTTTEGQTKGKMSGSQPLSLQSCGNRIWRRCLISFWMHKIVRKANLGLYRLMYHLPFECNVSISLKLNTIINYSNIYWVVVVKE